MGEILDTGGGGGQSRIEPVSFLKEWGHEKH